MSGRDDDLGVRETLPSSAKSRRDGSGLPRRLARSASEFCLNKLVPILG